MGVIPRPLYCLGRVAAGYTNYLGLPSRRQRTQNGHPRQGKSPPPLLFSLARPSVGESIGRVLCSWRLDEIEARFWRAPPGGCVAASQSGSIRTV